MLAVAVTFLTPRAAVLAVLALVPVGAIAVAERRVVRARHALGLAAPEQRGWIRRCALVSAFVLLLVLAATQPVVRSQASLRARTDAQVFVLLDVSRSMLASPSPGGPTRLAAAKREALALGARLPGVPLGVATLTDRVLPDLFPSADRASFDSVVSSVHVEDPPPRDVNTVATTFDALTQLATEGFFSPRARHRAVVLVTDGESRAYDPASVAAALSGHGIRLTVVRVGAAGDRVWRPDGKPEANFRPDVAGAQLAVQSLRRATGGSGPADPASAVASVVGDGPTTVVGVEPRSRTLAPLAALLALVPLALLLGDVRPEWLRRVTSPPQGIESGDVVS